MKYTVVIEAGNKDETVWQAVTQAEVFASNVDSAEEVARWVATNQTVAPYVPWRVRVWEGIDQDHEPAAEIYMLPLGECPATNQEMHMDESNGPTRACRAKFYCHGFSESAFSPGGKVYTFIAAYDDGTPENERYAKASPSGLLSITVDNPAVTFEAGRYYYLDFTLVPTVA